MNNNLQLHQTAEEKIQWHFDNCYDIYTSTNPADRKSTEQAITSIYKSKRLGEPQYIWFKNPLNAALFATFKKLLSPYAGFFSEHQLPARRFLRIEQKLRSIVTHAIENLPVDDPLNNVRNPTWINIDRTLLQLIQKTFWYNFKQNGKLLNQYADAFCNHPHIWHQVTERFDDTDTSNKEIAMLKVYHTLEIALRNGTFRKCYERTHNDIIFSSISNMLHEYQLFKKFHRASMPNPILNNWQSLSENCFCWIPYIDVCLICDRPSSIHMSDTTQNERQLHCENGPAIQFRNGSGFYCFNGVVVDEQIINNPQTQTINQILKEPNEEVRRIRIERYGWLSFLTKTNAHVIEHTCDEITQTHESLMQLAGIRVLICACPSTARVYAMQVPLDCSNVGEAQHFLSSGLSQQIIGAS